jgi:hypothetical protein
MRYVTVLCCALLLLAGCSPREFSGTDDPPPGDGDAVEPFTRTVALAYEVRGSYEECDITFRNANGHVRELPSLAPPWDTSFEVTLTEQTGPFEALVRATCRAPFRLGKSTVAVYLDGEPVATQRATGYGATAEVRRVVWRSE